MPPKKEKVAEQQQQQPSVASTFRVTKRKSPISKETNVDQEKKKKVPCGHSRASTCHLARMYLFEVVS